MKVMRTELHCHSLRSYDGLMSLDEILQNCRLKGIDAVAITDHNRAIESSWLTRARRSGVRLIPGFEITTDCGAHIIGLFVTNLPKKRSLKAVVDHVLAEGGLVSIPHPLKKESGLLAQRSYNDAEVQYTLKNASFIEYHNAKAVDGLMAKRIIISLANHYRIRLIVGSDAHAAWDIGRCVSDFSLPQSHQAVHSHAIKIADQPILKVQRPPLTKTQNDLLFLLRKNKLTCRAIAGLPVSLKKQLKRLFYLSRSKRYLENFQTARWQADYLLLNGEPGQ
jgi:predicted metal-dependent phosphoesterase TrpH